MSFSNKTPEDHIRSLDGVRGIAVLLVMVYHFIGVARGAGFHIPRILAPVSEAGWVGVDIFFVLSGFLITRILVASRGGPHYFKNFYGRRLLRIFPLYYLTLFVAFWILPGPPEFRNTQIWFWVYGSNFLAALRHAHVASATVSLDHFWSLAIEEHFYLVWPLVVYATGSRRRVFTCIAIAFLATSVLSRELVRELFGGRGAYVLTPCRLDGLVLGSLLAMFGELRFSRWSRTVGLGSFVASAVIAVGRGTFSPHDRVVQDLGFPLIALGASSLVLEAASQEGQRWLSSRALVTLGTYSYGIYVVHGLIRPIAGRLLSLVAEPANRWHDAFSVLGFVSVAALASCVLAAMSYHVFERRFLSIKDRWFARSGGPDRGHSRAANAHDVADACAGDRDERNA